MNSEIMNINTKDNVVFLTFKEFEKYGFLNHAISTRHGGISTGEKTSSMNLGLKTNDSIETVKENFKIFCNVTRLNYENITLANQTHSDGIRIIMQNDVGKGFHRERDYTDVDGIITNLKDVPLMIHTADCVPDIFADIKKKVIGAAHCGWKGTFESLSVKMVEKMKEEFGCSYDDIICGIAVAIGVCCYEVSKELFCQFKDRFNAFSEAFEEREGKYFLNLKLLNKLQLESVGIKSENISVCDICTKCNSNDLFSHRTFGDGRGMIGTFISLN